MRTFRQGCNCFKSSCRTFRSALMEVTGTGVIGVFFNGLLVHRTWGPNLINDLACSAYAVNFSLPKEQAAVFFSNVYHSFSVRRWVTEGLCRVHMEEYLQLIDDVRFAYVDEGGVDPELSNMISFLPLCPELVRKTRIMTMFRPCSLCLDHGKLYLPEVKFESSASIDNGPDFQR